MATRIEKTTSYVVPLYFLSFAMIVPGIGHCAPFSGMRADQAGGTAAGIQIVTEKKQRQVAWNALQNLQNMPASQHNQAVDEARKVVNAMDQRIGDLEGQVGDACESDGLTTSEEERRDDMLREIRFKRITLEKWYGGIEYGNENNWKKLKQGFANAYFDLNNYFGKSVLAFNRDGAG